MSVEFQCSCGKRLRLSVEAAGGKGQCPACGSILELPTAERSAPPSEKISLASGTSTALTDDPSDPWAVQTAATEVASEPGWGEGVAGQADEGPALTRPAYRLASPGQIGLAGFLGGPMGGFLLMGRNYAKCGRPAAGWAAVAVGALVTAVAVGSGFVLPDNSRALSFCVSLPLWIGTYLTAKILQQRTFEAHRLRGGAQASGWAVVGFTLLGIALTLGGAFGAAALGEIAFGDHRLQVTRVEEIYYGHDVPEAEARSLGRVLQQQGFFDGVGEKSVRLHKDSQGYVLIIILRSGFHDPRVHQEIRAIAGELSHAFGGQPVRVELCDEWETPKKLPAERKP